MLASVYVHLNPIRTKMEGLDKKTNRAEGLGLVEMDREKIRHRLRSLRAFRWSSYGAYAGYRATPEWLTTRELMERAGGRKAYRRYVQQHVTRGAAPEGYEDIRGRVALGSQAFQSKVKEWVGRVTKEQPSRSQVLKHVSVEAVKKLVEHKRGEKWETFADRHGDWGRELVLYLARRRSGLTLQEIGAALGIEEYKTVGKAVQRFRAALATDVAKRRMVKECLADMSLVET